MTSDQQDFPKLCAVKRAYFLQLGNMERMRLCWWMHLPCMAGEGTVDSRSCKTRATERKQL